MDDIHEKDAHLEVLSHAQAIEEEPESEDRKENEKDDGEEKSR